MCRADVAVEAQAPLASILVEMATALAAMEGHDPADVRIGPVDFGPEPTDLGEGAHQ
jgi:hypothetical protein